MSIDKLDIAELMPKNLKLTVCRLKTQQSNQLAAQDVKTKPQYLADRGDSNEPESPRPKATLPSAIEKSLLEPLSNSIEVSKLIKNNHHKT